MEPRRIQAPPRAGSGTGAGTSIRRSTASWQGGQRAHAHTVAGSTGPHRLARRPSDPLTDDGDANRCFAAYAAHELRGAITLQRTLAEVALADPGAGTAALRAMGERVVAACEHQERMLDALLTLARSDPERLRREPVNLATTTADVLRGHDHHGLRCTATLEPARMNGDPQLVERLVANLVANAIRHNLPHGRLDVATHATSERAIFTITNTGPLIPAGELTRLFLPFQQLSARAGGSADGVGLGLAIVRAIANAHDAAITTQARTSGGLTVRVAFPARE